MFDDREPILPDFHHHSFLVPVEESYEFFDAAERQAYGRFHCECRCHADGTYTMKKCASRVLAGAACDA